MSIVISLPFGSVEIYEEYIIAVMDEGITLEPKHNEVLVSIADKYFKNKTFAYITHRIHSYSIDPRIYMETSKIENLVAFAIVSEKQINLTNAQIEELFLRKPFKAFKKVDQAINWVKIKIKEQKQLK